MEEARREGDGLKLSMGVWINLGICVLAEMLMMASPQEKDPHWMYTLEYLHVVERGQWYRIITSSFVHYGLVHLLLNMSALASTGVRVERDVGTVMFLTLVIVYVLIGNLLFLLVCGLIGNFVDESWLRYNVVGFSGVLFALMVLDCALTESANRIMFSLRIPSRAVPWASLVLIQVFVPESSMLGHFCGIVAGYLSTYGLFCIPKISHTRRLPVPTLMASHPTFVPAPNRDRVIEQDGWVSFQRDVVFIQGMIKFVCAPCISWFHSLRAAFSWGEETTMDNNNSV